MTARKTRRSTPSDALASDAKLLKATLSFAHEPHLRDAVQETHDDLLTSWGIVQAVFGVAAKPEHAIALLPVLQLACEDEDPPAPAGREEDEEEEEEEPIARFLDECTEDEAEASTESEVLWAEYNDWCTENGEETLTTGAFKKALEERYSLQRIEGVRCYVGVRLIENLVAPEPR